MHLCTKLMLLQHVVHNKGLKAHCCTCVELYRCARSQQVMPLNTIASWVLSALAHDAYDQSTGICPTSCQFSGTVHLDIYSDSFAMDCPRSFFCQRLMAVRLLQIQYQKCCIAQPFNMYMRTAAFSVVVISFATVLGIHHHLQACNVRRCGAGEMSMCCLNIGSCSIWMIGRL